MPVLVQEQVAIEEAIASDPPKEGVGFPLAESSKASGMSCDSGEQADNRSKFGDDDDGGNFVHGDYLQIFRSTAALGVAPMVHLHHSPKVLDGNPQIGDAIGGRHQRRLLDRPKAHVCDDKKARAGYRINGVPRGAARYVAAAVHLRQILGVCLGDAGGDLHGGDRQQGGNGLLHGQIPLFRIVDYSFKKRACRCHGTV